MGVMAGSTGIIGGGIAPLTVDKSHNVIQTMGRTSAEVKYFLDIINGVRGPTTGAIAVAAIDYCTAGHG